MPQVGVYDLPSGGAFGYTATDDPLADSATHELEDSGSGSIVNSVVAGTNVTVDSTDPHNPIVSTTGGGGGGQVNTVVGGDGITVDSTDPVNPIVDIGGSFPDGSDLGVMRKRTVHLTAGDISTLNSVPFTVIAAPGVGKLIVPVVATVQYIPGNTEYSLSSAIGLCYNADPTLIPFGTNDPMAGTIDQVAIEVVNTGIAAGIAGMGLILSPPPLASVTDVPITLFASSADPTIYGIIVTSALNAGGTLYAPGDTGTIDGDVSLIPSPPVPATYTVLTVAPITGAVLTYAITNHDPGYLVAPGVTTTPGGAQPGVGTGFTIDINSIPAADGDLYVTVYYTIETLH